MSAPPLPDRESVLEQMAGHPAVSALLAWKSEALTDAKWDREELTLTVARDDIRAAAAAVEQAGYNFLEDVTCVDWYPADPRFRVVYHLLSHGRKERLRLAAMVREDDPTIDSITPLWPAANFYEREVADLFGVRFDGHPNPRRIMMPEEWEGHPLRKDYPVEGYR